MATFVVDQRSEQMREALGTIARADEDGMHRRQHACRSFCETREVGVVADEQFALDESVEYASDIALFALQSRNFRRDACDVFVERTEFAAHIERVQDLQRHHVRLTAGARDEQAFFGGQRRGVAVFRGVEPLVRSAPRGAAVSVCRLEIECAFHRKSVSRERRIRASDIGSPVRGVPTRNVFPRNRCAIHF